MLQTPALQQLRRARESGELFTNEPTHVPQFVRSAERLKGSFSDVMISYDLRG